MTQNKDNHAGVFRVPLLAYHHIMDADSSTDDRVANSPFTVSREQFRQQMRHLAENGFKTIGLDQLTERIAGRGQDEPGPAIVITFDDGWRDNFQFAFPTLVEFGLTATFFVISGSIDSEEYMSWAQLREMQNRGMQIESHTHSHVPLELLTESDAEQELLQSRALIEQRVGKAVRYMSFPHGSYNKGIIDMAEQAGYAACGTSNIGYAHRRSAYFELPRMLVRKSNTLDYFASVCSANTAVMLQSRAIYGAKNLLKNTIGLKNYMALHRMLYRTRPQVTDLGGAAAN
jgi:peptidoglycan/xylan/chitin deacetylase (PgdA/CDA1 family)